MSAGARAILGELLAARNERSASRAAQLLSDDVRYWDCERGEVEGREAVAAALTGVNARAELETIAAGDADVVAELQLEAAGARYRSTEVYRLTGGRIASLKAYFDPAARR
jgi:ketosteroid isomerase-like protein